MLLLMAGELAELEDIRKQPRPFSDVHHRIQPNQAYEIFNAHIIETTFPVSSSSVASLLPRCLRSVVGFGHNTRPLFLLPAPSPELHDNSLK